MMPSNYNTAGTDAPPAIDVEALALVFGDRAVLTDFSMTVASGEKVVLAGPSGSGKSSILACLLGFLVPAAGRIAIRGEPLTAQSVWRLRREIALVQQEPDLGDRSAGEWLEEPFHFHANASRRDHLSRLPDVLRHVRLPPGILAQKSGDLSGGEKQRLALVGALLLDRPILLLDEPTSALDADSRDAVYACLAGLRGKSLLMISHDTGRGLDFADRVVSLSPGEAPHGRA